MSRTKLSRTLPRVDNYSTPAWCVHRLLEVVALPGGRWLEPCVGGGAIVDAVAESRHDVEWSTVDIRPETQADLVTDFTICDSPELDDLAPEGELWDVCLTNPPYSLAMEFLLEARRRAHWVALLLRLGWLSSASRHAYLSEHHPDVYVLPNRPSFGLSERGSDSADYAWMVWEEGIAQRYGTYQVLDLTPLATRRIS